jgi:hypothetical protein
MYFFIILLLNTFPAGFSAANGQKPPQMVPWAFGRRKFWPVRREILVVYMSYKKGRMKY